MNILSLHTRRHLIKFCVSFRGKPLKAAKDEAKNLQRQDLFHKGIKFVNNETASVWHPRNDATKAIFLHIFKRIMKLDGKVLF